MKIKRYIYIIAATCLLSAAAFSAYQIYSYYAHLDVQTQAFDRIAESVEKAQSQENPQVGTAQDADAPRGGESGILPEYSELYQQNEDVVGWIAIDGTTINYPVMQTPDSPDFYLNHNFDREQSNLGVPYIQENCDIFDGENLVIYGHHIKGRKMFGALESYTQRSFYEENKIVRFDTLAERAEYEIVAIFKTVAYSTQGFKYFEYIGGEGEEAFDAYISKCKELALYDINATAQYGDKLITLVTCEYSASNGRLVLVAKKLENSSI